MALVNKDAWKASTLRTREVEVEELGGSVRIRELPASTSADLSGLLDIVQVGREQRAKVDVATLERRQFAYGVIDAKGEAMFTEDEVKEIRPSTAARSRSWSPRSTTSQASTRRRSASRRPDFRAAEMARMGQDWMMSLPPGVMDPMFLTNWRWNCT